MQLNYHVPQYTEKGIMNYPGLQAGVKKGINTRALAQKLL
jgi:hypothetical protein